MDENELRAYAQSLGIDPARAESWRRGFKKDNPNAGSKPKGKLRRPKGMLSVGDAIEKFGVDAATLRQWRAEGLGFETKANMILLREKELDRWIERKFGDGTG